MHHATGRHAPRRFPVPRPRAAALASALICATVLLGACGKAPPPLVTVPATPPAAVLLRDVAVLDVATGALAAGRDVLLEAGNITSIADTGAAAPAGATVIEGRGATLLPGLIDMHGHTGNASAPSWAGALPQPERNLQSYLYCGVTTVLDPADLSSEAFVRRDAVRAGTLIGPRVYAAGPIITAPGGHPVAILESLAPWWLRWYLVPRFARQVADEAQARAAVRELAGLRADVIKIAVDSLPDGAPHIGAEALAAAVDEAKQHKLRAVAHIGTTQDALDAGEAGVALWLHGVYKERIPDEQIARLAAFGIPMVTTTEVFDAYARLGESPRVATPLERETVEAAVLESFNHIPAEAQVSEFRPYLDKLRAARPHWGDNLRRLRAAGVTILAGSDTQSGVFPGPGLHRELGQLVAAGLTPAEAIRAATLDAARFLEAGEPAYGVVAPGKRADLLLVEGDPTQDVAALSRIRAVILGGVPLERHALP